MNKVILTGNLANEPEIRMTANGIAACSFRLAVQRKVRNQQGEREADFITIVTWRKLAELCGKYLAKGRKCAVEGAIQTRTYQRQDGGKGFAVEVVAENVEFLDSKAKETTSGDQAAPGSGPPDGFAETDDELPF